MFVCAWYCSPGWLETDDMAIDETIMRDTRAPTGDYWQRDLPDHRVIWLSLTVAAFLLGAGIIATFVSFFLL